VTTALSPNVLRERPHRRLNALTGEWVFVSPHRSGRPWEGRREAAEPAARNAYEAGCYLCPGNARANGAINPPYTSTYVFTNDFPAFLPDGHPIDASHGQLLRAETRQGTCRVICYSPRHDLTLAHLSKQELLGVIETWSLQETELLSRWRWVQVFENKGELMGCSNPHPHGQIWAGDFIPNEVGKELAAQWQWLKTHERPLLVEYAELEQQVAERVVASNDHWIAVVPWWAVWPFETLMLPRRHVRRLGDMSATEQDGLADVMGDLLKGYDTLFGVPFPYSFGWHGAPGGGKKESEECQLHAHFYPPLLRSASVKKFMVGYEMLAEAQRDITPEQAAERLRAAVSTRG